MREVVNGGSWTFDMNANAFYAYVLDNTPSCRTRQLADGTALDYDEAGRVIGVEILSPSKFWSPAWAMAAGLRENDANFIKRVLNEIL